MMMRLTMMGMRTMSVGMYVSFPTSSCMTERDLRSMPGGNSASLRRTRHQRQQIRLKQYFFYPFTSLEKKTYTL